MTVDINILNQMMSQPIDINDPFGFNESKQGFERMDNQHKEITGYRDLTQEEINLMNRSKELASQVGDFIEHLSKTGYDDKRWLAIAKTDLQKGFMSLTRSIAKPSTF